MSSRLVKFALVGGIGFVVDALVFSAFFYLLDVPLFVSRSIAFLFAATSTWIGNRLFTFSDREREAKLRQWLRFMLTASFSAIPNFAAFSLVTYLLGSKGPNALIALVIGVLVGMVSNYIISSKWVFKTASSET